MTKSEQKKTQDQIDIQEVLSKLEKIDTFKRDNKLRAESIFEEIFLVYSPRVDRYVNWYVQRRLRYAHQSVVDEVVTDTFFFVWQNPKRFNGKSKFATFLIGIAFNKARDALDSELRFTHEDLEDILEIGHESADPAEQFGRREALLRCLPLLNEKQQETLRLVHIQGLSQREVSKEMGIPIDTVKSRLREIIKKIKPCLERAMVRNVTVQTNPSATPSKQPAVSTDQVGGYDQANNVLEGSERLRAEPNGIGCEKGKE